MGKVIKMSDIRFPSKGLKPSRKKRSLSFQDIEGKRPIEKPLTRHLHNFIPSGSWKGRRCFILGGGPSLKGFDFSRLNGELVIACNRAFESFPEATIMIAQDTRLWGWYESGDLGDEAKEKFRVFKGFKTWINAQSFPFPEDLYLIDTYPAKDIDWKGYDYSRGLPKATNTGLNALCLAVALGADPIYLLGFDCYGKNGRTANFHEGYPDSKDDVLYKDAFLPNFNDLSEDINKVAKVINLNPRSEIKCFEFGDVSEVLKKVVCYYGYAGIGDNVWQLPFVKDIARKVDEFYIETYTPQFYWNIPNVKFIKPKKHRFEMHWNIVNSLPADTWSDVPQEARELPKPAYWSGFKYGLTIPEQFQDLWGTNSYDISFEVKPEWAQEGKRIINGLDTKGKKICVMHFPTERPEWKCPARDPKPEYMQLIVDKYHDEYFFISLADLRNEVFYCAPKGIDKEFHQGELSLEQMIGLVKEADMIISGNCYLFALGIGIGTKTFYIGGGTQDVKLFFDKRMNLSNVAYVQPEPFCACLNSMHDCYKDIPERKILSTFEELKDRKPKKHEKILFYMVGPRYHKYIDNNIDLHIRYFVSIVNKPIEDLRQYIKDNDIDIIITTYYPTADIKDLGIKYMFFEAFLGDNKVFDRAGFHYSPDNEIKRYVDKVKMRNIAIPDYTKIKQPEKIGRREFFKKYEIPEEGKYIVILGQELGDKSLLHSKNKDVKDYRDYIHCIVTSNPDVCFLFKPHPAYYTIKKHLQNDMDFINQYQNIKFINENIHSLFEIFDKFTAFSSTTIFEGLMRGRKFATVGHHFCDDSRVVLEMTDRNSFDNLYEKLEVFTIDEDARKKYMNFLLNYYSINLDSPRVVDRIEKTSNEYMEVIL